MSIDGSTVETIRGIRCFGTGDFVRVVYPKDTPHPAEGCHAMLFGQFMQDTSGEEVFVAEKARIFPGASRFIERLKSRAAGGNSTGLTGSHRKSRGLLWVNDRVYDVEDFEIALKEAEKSNRDEPKESSADQTLDTRARPGDEPEEESGASQRDTREEPEGHGLHAREERAQRPMLTGADMGDSPSVTQPSDSASRAEAGLTRPMDRTTLEGKIDKIIYKNLETRYVVCTLTTGEKFTGRFADGIDLLLAQGVHVRLRGVWVNQPIYGMQFQADKIRETDIVLDSEDDKDRASLAALKSYLASGLLKGVGVKFAERIIERFGERTLEVLDSDPVNRLMEVDGIGRRRAEQIAVAWNAQHFLRKLMLFLKPFGIGPALCNRIARSYGDDALLVEHIKRNPYRLVESVKGVGFTTADRIAAGVGIDPDAVERYAAGLIHILRQAENFEGHSYLTIEDAFGRVLKLLFGNMTTIETPSAIDRRERFRQGIEALKDREALVITGDKEPRLYTPEMDKAERGIVEHLHRLFFASGGGHTEIVGSAVVGRSDTRERVITWINERFPTLTSAQRDAVCIAAERPIMILTGGPGVGKTHTAAAIIQMWQDLLGIKEIMLTAPTGRAANRLTAAAGSREDLQGITIHRCLECDRKGRFLRDERNPLAAQAIIVDECSMIDAQLAHAFFRAIPFGARLVLIGDADQLPSVGPGRVFADLFDSQIFPTVYLQDIFRQAMKSTIVRVAHEIRNGRFPFMPRVTLPEQVPIEAEQSDLVFLEAPDPETGAKFLIELCCGKDTDTDETPTPLVPFDPVREIQVLSPGYRGEIGIRNLNIEIQKRLNPQRTPLSSQLRSSEVLLRIGDRVVQTVNNYDKGVFNGDIGMIMHIPDPDATENEDGQGNPPLLVDFGNAEEWVPYEYPSEAIDQLQLAWALSVHKAQGGGYPCVVVPIFTTHSILLTRNLLYTAITRAQELCVVIGSYRAISMAVRNESGKKRNTSLVQRLEQIL
jgi:exodeoxyribonuclease V alpha subunit